MRVEECLLLFFCPSWCESLNWQKEERVGRENTLNWRGIWNLAHFLGLLVGIHIAS
jgi:hypothetical protein